MKEELLITRAEKEDIDNIYALLKESFGKEAETYQDFKIPAIIQPKQDFSETFSEYIYLKAVLNDKVVAVIRGQVEENICHIGRLAVHPDFQDKGIGTRLLEKIEEEFAFAKSYELFTGILSKRNLYFYEKQGYKFSKEKKVNGRLIFYLTKPNFEE
ncbi:GNAT family N-acetyltransferase [Candidatus Margulisiibacteriota bacterium]